MKVIISFLCINHKDTYSNRFIEYNSLYLHNIIAFKNEIK